MYLCYPHFQYLAEREVGHYGDAFFFSLKEFAKNGSPDLSEVESGVQKV
jgi:hypothetical protein